MRQKGCWNLCIFMFCVYVVISKFVATTLHHVKRVNYEMLYSPGSLRLHNKLTTFELLQCLKKLMI